MVTLARRRVPVPGTAVVPCSRPGWEFRVLPARLLQVQPRVFHGPDFTLPARCPFPAVVTVHDTVPWDAPGDLSWRARLWYRWRTPPSVRSARLVLADSAWAAGRVAAKFPDSRVAHLLPGAGPEFSAGAGDRPKEILYVGGVTPRKRLGALLDAFSVLQGDDPRWRMRWVGYRGRGSAPILERAGAAGVEWEEGAPTARVAEAMRGAAVLVYPSGLEGFGLPVLEALASATPVVALDTPVAREAGGDAALYSGPEAAALAESVRAAAALATDHGWRQKAREHAARLSWRRAAERYVNLLMGAVA